MLDNVDSPAVEATFILLILREHEDLYHISAPLQALKPRVKIVYVDAVTEGAACTALLAKELVNDATPLLIVNSDQFVEWDATAFWEQMVAEHATSHGNVLCFKVPMELNDVKWSYAKVDDAGRITDIQEKVVISENATVGFYYWREGRDFVGSAEEMVAAGLKVNGEYYVAPVYNIGTAKGQTYTLSFCDRMWGLGVPEDLTRFLTLRARPSLTAHRSSWPTPHPRTPAPLRFISRRGNLEGPDAALENNPDHVCTALAAGFDVEVDAWADAAGAWALGTSGPQHPVPYSFLLQPGLWVHCRNGAALRALRADARIHSFWHGEDDYALTSRALIWAGPGSELDSKTVAVGFANPASLLDSPVFGIASSDVGALRRASIARVAPTAQIQLIVFDLDGVLVDSRDLHYEALNMAIAQEAGAQYVITRHEHEHVYDGLSTNQKLRLMTLAKELPIELHKPIWARKQALTDQLVAEQLKPTAHVTELLRTLKACGYPVAVASNCIASSVKNILTSIGLLHFVDARYSNEDVPYAKPSPDIYQKACASFGLQPCSVLVVEDSVKGFEAALRAGCHLLKVGGTHDVNCANLFRRLQEVEAAPKPITVVIPLAGPSSQAWLDGPETPPCEVPVFLTDVRGRSLLEWAVSSIRSLRFPMRFIFVVKEEQARVLKLESLCVKAAGFEPTTVVKLRSETLGALKTVLAARNLIPLDAPLLIFDGSHVVQWGSGASVDDMLSTCHDSAVTVFSSNDPRWSYVRTASNSRTVLELHEKIAVSNLACSGLYFSRRAADFMAAADAVVAKDVRTRGLFFVAPTYNEVIAQGSNVEACSVEQAWSLRSAAEAGSFARHFFSAVAADSLDDIYSEMATRQAGVIAASGYQHDAELLAPDARRCQALYALCTPASFTHSVQLKALLARLKSGLGGRHVIYDVLSGSPAPDAALGALHFTFMQLVGFDMFAKVDLPAGYRDALEAVLLQALPAFHINFSRVVVTNRSIMLAGHPTVDVNFCREQVRSVLSRASFPLYEPYKSDIVHMTLVRFASPVTDAEKATLATALSECAGAPLGSMHVTTLSLTPSSWKMLPCELPAAKPIRLLSG